MMVHEHIDLRNPSWVFSIDQDIAANRNYIEALVQKYYAHVAACPQSLSECGITMLVRTLSPEQAHLHFDEAANLIDVINQALIAQHKVSLALAENVAVAVSMLARERVRGSEAE
jgi:deoxyribodipyrimidine photolyase